MRPVVVYADDARDGDDYNDYVHSHVAHLNEVDQRD